MGNGEVSNTASTIYLHNKMLCTKNYTLIKAHCNLIGIIISFTHCREEEYFIMYIVLDKY